MVEWERGNPHLHNRGSNPQTINPNQLGATSQLRSGESNSDRFAPRTPSDLFCRRRKARDLSCVGSSGIGPDDGPRWLWRIQKTGMPKWVALVSGNMDQNSCGLPLLLILSHSQIENNLLRICFMLYAQILLCCNGHGSKSKSHPQ